MTALALAALRSASSDIVDTCFAVQMVQSADILIADVKKLLPIIAAARRNKIHAVHRRSHGIHGEPTNVRLKMALMHDEFSRALERLDAPARSSPSANFPVRSARTRISRPPWKFCCKQLGLVPAAIRHAGGAARHPCRVHEHARAHRRQHGTLAWSSATCNAPKCRSRGSVHRRQKGSSAMPHKRNPITWDAHGLARVLRGTPSPLWRTSRSGTTRYSHSSVERIIFPDSCTLLDYMFGLLTRLMAFGRLSGDMKKNLGLSLGMWNSQTACSRSSKKV